MEVAGKRVTPPAKMGEKEEGPDPVGQRLIHGNKQLAPCGIEDLTTEPEGEHPDRRLSGSDGDADVEDAVSQRRRGVDTAHRSCCRRRRRPKVVKQDTTESEDDLSCSQTKPFHWDLQLNPQSEPRTLSEESISQIRPLVLSRVALRAAQTDSRPDCEVRAPSLCRRGDISCLVVTSIFFIPLGLLLLQCMLQQET
ncbi:uncharacterized protein [Narcine bancroftii]|uniref:uncharacterized protein isoform X2 n=1 Tax=Narcine bancroftii TaxID=1343680 RepID=UPI00383185B9